MVVWDAPRPTILKQCADRFGQILMEKPRTARLLHQLLVLYQRAAT